MRTQNERIDLERELTPKELKRFQKHAHQKGRSIAELVRLLLFGVPAPRNVFRKRKRRNICREICLYLLRYNQIVFVRVDVRGEGSVVALWDGVTGEELGLAHLKPVEVSRAVDLAKQIYAVDSESS